MKKVLFSFSFVLLSIAAYAQGPAFGWAKRFAGFDDQRGCAIQVDNVGSVFTAGDFENNVDFDPGAGTASLFGFSGEGAMFISKLDNDGNYVWAKKVGGGASNVVHPNAMALDASSNVYLTGYFYGTVDFNAGGGTANLTSTGWDVYVCKYDSAGNFIWAKQFSGAQDQEGLGIDVDTDGNVYTTGYLKGTVDFDPGAGTANLTCSAASMVFISKLNSLGDYVWAKAFDGLADEGKAIDVDDDGNVYLTGAFRGTTDFDPGPGTASFTNGGTFSDIFICKLDSAGVFGWAKQIGFTSEEIGFSIKVDASGNVYTAGEFNASMPVDFDPGAGTANLTSAGLTDVFISKLDNAGEFVWVKQFAGTGYDRRPKLELDQVGDVYLTGDFSATTDFDPGVDTFALTSGGSPDIFIAKLNASGNFEWAGQIGNVYTSFANAIDVDGVGNAYLTGYYGATMDFNPDTGTFNLVFIDEDDAFVVKLGDGVPSFSINEEGEVAELKIYPNPSTGIFTIESKTNISSIEIINVVGIYVASMKVENTKATIDLTGQPSGIYFYRVYNGNKISGTGKLILK